MLDNQKKARILRKNTTGLVDQSKPLALGYAVLTAPNYSQVNTSVLTSKVNVEILFFTEQPTKGKFSVSDLIVVDDEFRSSTFRIEEIKSIDILGSVFLLLCHEVRDFN